MTWRKRRTCPEDSTGDVHMQERRQRAEDRKLQAMAAAADLLRQRSRMLRAFGSIPVEAEVEIEVEAEEPLALPDPAWKEPYEWDAGAQRQWEDFMHKSRALRVSFTAAYPVKRLIATFVGTRPTIGTRGKNA